MCVGSRRDIREFNLNPSTLMSPSVFNTHNFFLLLLKSQLSRETGHQANPIQLKCLSLTREMWYISNFCATTKFLYLRVHINCNKTFQTQCGAVYIKSVIGLYPAFNCRCILKLGLLSHSETLLQPFNSWTTLGSPSKN